MKKKGNEIVRKIMVSAVFVLGLTYSCFAANDLCVEPTKEKHPTIEDQMLREKDEQKNFEELQVKLPVEKSLNTIKNLVNRMGPLLEPIYGNPVDTKLVEDALQELKAELESLTSKIQQLRIEVTERDKKIAILEEENRRLKEQSK